MRYKFHTHLSKEKLFKRLASTSQNVSNSKYSYDGKLYHEIIDENTFLLTCCNKHSTRYSKEPFGPNWEYESDDISIQVGGYKYNEFRPIQFPFKVSITEIDNGCIMSGEFVQSRVGKYIYLAIILVLAILLFFDANSIEITFYYLFLGVVASMINFIYPRIYWRKREKDILNYIKNSLFGVLTTDK